MSVLRLEGPRLAVTDFRRDECRRPARNRSARVLASLREWRRRARDRAELAALDDRMLADIGISRADAEFLANKPFWRE
jgi:uncharacterized protein YjiS (DUF1127 family)